MPDFAQNVAAALASVLIVATSLTHVVTVPPAQAAHAAVIIAPAVA